MRAKRQLESRIPACWTWPLPPLADVQYDPETSACDLRASLMAEWQAGRCALCGLDLCDLVKDHDHKTGLVRGWLCKSCNVQEGYGGNGDIFVCYRHVHPASIWHLEWEYEGWGYGPIVEVLPVSPG